MMGLTYVKKFRVERLKLAIVANHHRHGVPLPKDVVECLAREFDVQSDWVRRIEKRDDIDLEDFKAYRRRMKRDGVDADAAAGRRVVVGGADSRRFRKAAIKARLQDLLDQNIEPDLEQIAREFDLDSRSKWPRAILCEVEKEQAGPGKRPVSKFQREFMIDTLRALGADFGLNNEKTVQLEVVNKLLDSHSMSQIQKVLKNLYYLKRVKSALKSGFSNKVIKPYLDAIDFELW